LNALDTVIQVWWFVLGAVVGSFLNVVIHRLPRGESLVWPGSHCPYCGHSIRWFDNLPVLSWLILRGRCRDCSAPISVRYPLVEAISSAIVGSTAWMVSAGEWSKWLAAIAGMDRAATTMLLQVACFAGFLLTVFVVAAIHWDGEPAPTAVWGPCIGMTVLAYGLMSFWRAERDLPLLSESPLGVAFWVDLIVGTALGWGADMLNRHALQRLNRAKRVEVDSWDWTAATGVGALLWPAPVGIILGTLALLLQGGMSLGKFRASGKNTFSGVKRLHRNRGAVLALWGIANWGLLFLV